MAMFTHEKFEAYQLSLEFIQIALEVVDGLPQGHACLRDQLRRAAFSIPLNIAEGTGKPGRADRARFYAIARGSAMECAAICDLVVLIDSSFGSKAATAKGKLRSVVSIPSGLCGAE